jgi:hypothetical protein
MAKSKWMNALHPRKSSGYKFVKRIHFVDKVDFANKTLNQVGKRRRYLSKKEQAKVRKTKIDYAYGSSDNQIKMLHGDLHQQNYTGADKIIAIMDAGFLE